MRQLTNQQLDAKIANFMRDRLAAHPELQHSAARHMPQTNLAHNVVSRVKEWSEKFNHHYPANHTLYQV